MKELEKGNKRLVAELSLEQQGLKDVVSGNCYARSGVDFRIPTSRFHTGGTIHGSLCTE
jgi:hypothetical protein